MEAVRGILANSQNIEGKEDELMSDKKYLLFTGLLRTLSIETAAPKLLSLDQKLHQADFSTLVKDFTEFESPKYDAAWLVTHTLRAIETKFTTNLGEILSLSTGYPIIREVFTYLHHDILHKVKPGDLFKKMAMLVEDLPIIAFYYNHIRNHAQIPTTTIGAFLNHEHGSRDSESGSTTITTTSPSA